MDDENDAQLDVVFKNCKNNFQLFLSTIAEYLGRKPDFSTCDLTHVSQLFANAANTSKTRNNDNATVANGTSTGAGNGTSVEVSKSVQITDDDSRDMFETENDDDDEIIPETQFFQEESNDSGESVTIPLYVEVAGNNGRFRGSSEASEGADDSEFARVRPETEADDHTEQQSQMLMANMDQSILCDIETTYTEAIANNNSNVIVLTQTVASANEASSENNDTQIDDEPNDGGRVDRSTSTTPDIELSDHVCKNLADLASMTNSNAVEKQPTAEQRENVDSDDDDINETQMFSQNIYDANTQQLANRTHSPEPQSTQDLFLAATELVFKLPAAVSTPLVKTKPNPPIESQDVFDAPTHRMRSPKRLGEHVRGAAKQTSHEDSIYDAATQRAPQKEDINDADDFFGAATQIAPPRNPRGTSEPIEPEEDDVYIAETQLPPEDYVFDQPTQQMPSDKPSSSSKKTVTWKKPNESEPQKSNQHNVSDDLFDVGTQAFEAPEPSNNASEDLIETEFFDMPTQVVGMPSQNIPKQRLPAVLTQSSQPSLTPEWSMAARISNAAIDQFEKEQADREAEKKREKLRKNRYLFAASEDEDENEDDFDFDLALPSNPVERMSSLKESQKHGKNHDSLTRPLSASSTTTSDDSDSVPKKSNPVERVSSLKESQRQELLTRPLSVKRTKTSDDSDSVPKKSKPDANKSGKITQRDMDVKVKVSRQTVDEYLRKERQEQQNHSKKSSAPHETNKNSKATETKSVADKAPVQQRNLRRRKSEAETPPPNESRNKRKANANEDAQPKEKRGKKEPRELAALMRHSPPMAKTSASSKSKENESRLRNAKKDKDKDKAKENNISPAPMTTNIPDSHLLSSMKRRTSDRPSTCSSLGPAILFTKVNSAPYKNVIQKLGGAIVDTPQLGTILICDKISRTFKFLYALTKGIPIVSPRWLDASAKCGGFEPTDPYIVSDTNSEKRFRFSLRKSLEAARKTPLFVNYHICTTPNVQPITSEIAEIVERAGGKYVNNPLKERKPNTVAVLISHKKDSKMWKSYKDAHPDIQIVSSEGFLQSVVQQKINFSNFLLKE